MPFTEEELENKITELEDIVYASNATLPKKFHNMEQQLDWEDMVEAFTAKWRLKGF
jgi:hypothetical protein